MSKVVLEEGMFITYKNMNGQIKHIGRKYLTFNPFNSNAFLLVYKKDWKDVTLL